MGTKWTECTRAINYTMQKQNMLVYLQEFFVKRPDLKILYYSGGTHPGTPGPVSSAPHRCPISPSHPQHHAPPRPLDVDIATVPFAYTQYCLNGLHRPIVKRWKYAVPPIGPSPRSVWLLHLLIAHHIVEKKAVVRSRRAGGGGLQRGVRQVHLRHHQGRRTRGTLPRELSGSP